MAHERRRAALAALCVFAVALAATLFPASGFGGQPTGVGVGDGPDAPGDPGGSDARPDPASTADADPPTDAGATTTASDDGDDPPTETTTATETTTTVVGDTGPGGTGPDLFSAAVVAVLGLVALLGIVGFWTGALAVTTAAAGPLPFTVVVGDTPVGELVGRVPTRTMELVVGLSASVPRLLDDAAGLAGAVAGGLASVLGAAGRGTAEALRIGARGLGATVAAVPRALAGLGTGAGIFASLGSVSVPSFGRNRGRDGGRSRTRARPNDPEETGPPSVEEAWQAMRDRLAVGNRRARTPGELARIAVRRGYPDDAVRRLTDAFREVRYGGLPREGRTDAARSALDRLRDHWRDDE